MANTSAEEIHAILSRDKWRCTAIVADRLRPGACYRCPVMGSEMVVVNGGTYCPRHARETEEADGKTG